MRSGRDKKSYRDFSGGIQEFTSPLWTADNESPDSQGFSYSTPGILKRMRGTSTNIGESTDATGINKGLFTFRKSDGTEKLIKVFKTTLDVYTGSGTTWTQISSALTNNSTDFSNSANAHVDNEDRLYIATGLNDDVIHTDGVTSGAITGYKAKHIAYFQNKLYLANVFYDGVHYPNRVLVTTEGTDDIDVVNRFFDDVGEAITGVKVYGNLIYFFTKSWIATYDGYQLRFLPGEYGTIDGFSIKEVAGKLLWFTRGIGVYIYAGAGLPQIASRKIDTLIKDSLYGLNPDLTSVAPAAACEWEDGKYLLTVNNDGKRDLLLYDVLNNSWERKPDMDVVFATDITVSNTKKLYITTATDNGIYEYAGLGKKGSSTESRHVTALLDAGEPDEYKQFHKVYLVYKPQNSDTYITVKYRLNGDSSWSQINATNNNVSLLGTDRIAFSELVLPDSIKSRFIQFELSYSSATVDLDIYEIIIEFTVIKKEN